jgi:hypothetical protein
MILQQNNNTGINNNLGEIIMSLWDKLFEIKYLVELLQPGVPDL